MPTTAAEAPGAAELTGGCLCGAVRYRLLAEPHGAAWCHCRTCQLNSGSPAMAFARVAPEHLSWDAGEHLVRTISSSEHGERVFCGECGTPLMAREKDGSGSCDFNIATLDNPDAVKPGHHIYYASRIAWAEAGDDLPRYDRSRPQMSDSQ